MFIALLSLHREIFIAYVLTFISDVDECMEQKDDCDINANCTNRQGSYNCTCNDGYSGDGFTCQGNEYTLYIIYLLFLVHLVVLNNCNPYDEKCVLLPSLPQKCHLARMAV